MLLRAIITAILLTSCSGMESSEKRRIRKCNEKEEKIYRQKGENFFIACEVKPRPQDPYPWEKKGSILKKITEKFFHCRGSCINPKRFDIEDCLGEEGHSVALGEKKVAISPTLISLLNYIQDKTKERVIITTGYRCKEHNRYVDPSKKNSSSKHQTGMEVDFYVEKYEDNPTHIVALIMQYYKDPFIRQKINERGLRHPGWCNKEIALWIQEKDEGRDFDNRHPYPYVTIEVREGK